MNFMIIIIHKIRQRLDLEVSNIFVLQESRKIIILLRIYF